MQAWLNVHYYNIYFLQNDELLAKGWHREMKHKVILNDKMQKDYTEIGDTFQKIQTSAISSWVCDT